MAPLLFVISLVLCATGAYVIANTICQHAWEEKIPQSKLIGFAAVFSVTLFVLCFLMFLASMMAFGR